MFLDMEMAALWWGIICRMKLREILLSGHTLVMSSDHFIQNFMKTAEIGVCYTAEMRHEKSSGYRI